MPTDFDLRDLVRGLSHDQIADLVAGMSPGQADALLSELGAGAGLRLPQSPIEQAAAVDEPFTNRSHLTYLNERIVQAVRDVESGRSRRLVIEMPPRSGKTTLSTLLAPSWIMAHHPSWPIALTSHDGSLATSWGRRIRRWADAGKLGTVEVAADAGAAGEWETTDGGTLLSLSIRESFTGRGAKCVGEDSRILTEYGTLTAREAYDREIDWIMAYDHVTERAVWQRVVAGQRTDRRRVVEVTTKSGRVLICTPDHPISTSNGYRPAGSLRSGETLVACPSGDGLPLRGDLRGAGSGDPQGSQARSTPVPLVGVRSGRAGDHSKTTVLHDLREGSNQGTTDLLLEDVLQGAYRCTPGDQENSVSGMREEVLSGVVSDEVLCSGMCEQGTLTEDDWSGQLSPQPRSVIWATVPADAPVDSGERWRKVRGLPRGSGGYLHSWGEGSDSLGPVDPSHQRRRDGQSARELDHSLPDGSYGSPQVEGDTVAMVRDLGDREVDVYDFQVEGTSNFFADGLLVHNCLIIDDPHKDFVDAHSITMRDNVWDWWLAVAQLRLEPPSLVIVTQTRWHEDDFVGRLLSKDHEGDPSAWEVIRMPAIAEEGDLIGREVGEPLISPIIDETSEEALIRWAEVKSSVGEYVWSAMMQQRPAPAKGAIFDTSWWRYWTRDPSRVTEDGKVFLVDPETLTGAKWLDSWDASFGSTQSESASWVVGQRWARQGANRFLIAQQRNRWTFTETIRGMKQWTGISDPRSNPQGHLVHERLIEKKANGAAIIDTLKETVSGLKPINPTTSKESRARAVTPEIESGHVYLPHPSDPGNEWVKDFLSEVRNFPHDAADDQVDAMTQALSGLRDEGRGSITVPGGRGRSTAARNVVQGARSDLARARSYR